MQAAAKILYRVLDGNIDPAVSPADREILEAALDGQIDKNVRAVLAQLTSNTKKASPLSYETAKKAVDLAKSLHENPRQPILDLIGL